MASCKWCNCYAGVLMPTALELSWSFARRRPCRVPGATTRNLRCSFTGGGIGSWLWGATPLPWWSATLRRKATSGFSRTPNHPGHRESESGQNAKMQNQTASVWRFHSLTTNKSQINIFNLKVMLLEEHSEKKWIMITFQRKISIVISWKNLFHRGISYDDGVALLWAILSFKTPIYV